ncbi:MAG: hypothetical protein JWQ02_433 [Capsulimonas sp.]|jgi:hypothetical protein|nr:hypothetical protein [Capsulimonas sp.]
MNINYYQTFIQVAPDSAAETASAPTIKGEKKTIPALEYEMLSAQPYVYTQEELLFEVYVRHKGIPSEELTTRREALWAEFYSKPHACLRASSLAKTYGWGIHFNAEGKVGLVPIESPEYRRFAKDADLQQTFAMRSKRVR